MGTAILRPQDRPKLRYMPPQSSPPMNPRRNPIPRKRSPTDLHVNPGEKNSGRGVDRSVVVKCPMKEMVMGKVTILKRGEDLKVVDLKIEDLKIEDVQIEDRRLGEATGKDRKVRFEREDDSVLCSTEWLGPDPETVQKQVTMKVKEFNVTNMSYSSPEPSSLPRPLFFSKNLSAATRDLRRLLQLDLF